MTPARLALENGVVFDGISIGVDGFAVGEVVFNTAMTGYQEILTDPSYAKQIVTLTYPHIGNTGTNSEDVESDRVWAEGLVIRDLPLLRSSWRAEHSLSEFLDQERVVAIADIDTRKLTGILREFGSMAGCIVANELLSETEAIERARSFPGLSGMDLAKEVTRHNIARWTDGGTEWTVNPTRSASPPLNVVAYDYGVKRNILRILANQGCEITLVPAKTPADDVLRMQADGVFLSNGPGDPDPCDYAIRAITEIVDSGVPVFGICLGCQLLGLASGAQTIKMRHGHHGANHPVKDLDTGQVIITSQNHGFCIDGDSLPSNLKVTHVSLFDGSLQGVARTDRPAFGFQGHPEASPGPQDCQYLFSRFVDHMTQFRHGSADA